MMLCRKGSTGSVFYSLSGPGISGLYYIQLASSCTFLVMEESLRIMVKSGRPNNTICDLLYSSIKGMEHVWLVNSFQSCDVVIITCHCKETDS